MDALVQGVGALGAFFALLMVLAAGVETLMELLSFGLPGKKAKPDEVLDDIKEWVGDSTLAEAKVVAIQKLVNQSKSALIKLDPDHKDTVDAVGKLDAGRAQTAEGEVLVHMAMGALRALSAEVERKRVMTLRVVAGVIGCVIACALQLDAIRLLGGTVPKSSEVLAAIAHYAGCVITGFASSAGSSFWHDQLARLRSVKDAARSAQEMQSKLSSS